MRFFLRFFFLKAKDMFNFRARCQCQCKCPDCYYCCGFAFLLGCRLFLACSAVGIGVALWIYCGYSLLALWCVVDGLLVLVGLALYMFLWKNANNVTAGSLINLSCVGLTVLATLAWNIYGFAITYDTHFTAPPLAPLICFHLNIAAAVLCGIESVWSLGGCLLALAFMRSVSV